MAAHARLNEILGEGEYNQPTEDHFSMLLSTGECILLHETETGLFLCDIVKPKKKKKKK